MKSVLIINGPNLNMLGHREPEIYGTATLPEIMEGLKAEFPALNILHFQSNSEGAIIDRIQTAADDAACIGIVLNAGAYTHTSLAIADAIAAVAPLPVVEVHLSNVFAREEIRRHSLIAGVCAGSIAGFGPLSYSLAIRALESGAEAGS